MSFAVPLAACMFMGGRVSWNRPEPSDSETRNRYTSNAYTSNTVFCGVKALGLSLVAHYLCVRHWMLGGDTDVWFETTHNVCTRLGWNFFLWEVLDLAYIVYFRVSTPDMVFHHLFHILVTPILMTLATPTWYYFGVRLILQETSGIPLALAAFFRSRAPAIAKSAFFWFLRI